MSSTPGHEDIRRLRKQVKAGRDALGEVAASTELPHPDHVITNSQLLLRILEELVEDGHKFSYLPATITSHVLRELQELRSLMPDPDLESGWSATTLEDRTKLLLRLDLFYAYCLQYGIVSFGFDAKLAQEHVTELQSIVETAKSHRKRLESSFDQLGARAEQSTATIEQSLKEVHDRAVAAMEGLVAAASQSAQGAETERTKVTEHAAAIAAELTEVKAAAAHVATAKQTLEQTATSFTAERERVTSELAALVKSSQASDKQVVESAANSKAMEQAITEAKASANTQLKAIGEFYGDIETHKQDMLTTRKESQASFNELKSQSDLLTTELTDRTTAIVQSNEAMVDQIKDHLRKAVGVTLFTAFDTRRRRVFWGTFLWGGLLFGSTLGALIYAIWFVRSLAEVLKAGEDVAIEVQLIFARLVIAAPIAFFIAFCARQYGRERRAGEEYAFKSAISVSLEPYRDLLVRMHKDNPGVETDFVRTLMLEIFDNPAKRLYMHREESSQAPEDRELMQKAMDKMLDRL